jgi:hypothetical protein
MVGANEVTGAMVNILGVLFGVYNGMFYSIISSISAKFVPKIFNVVTMASSIQNIINFN